MSDGDSSISPGSMRLRVAVVGSGPAGFYTAAEVLKRALGATVNMFERLPTPWGLLRAGVAPDHENMRVVGTLFDRIAQNPGFRLYANVEVGSDVSHEDLAAQHHAVVYATGALCGIAPGLAEGRVLDNCLTADRIVGWYNGHPDYADSPPDLSSARAVVVGNGNVALDVARMLTRGYDELRTTDISDLALDLLERSKLSEVVIVGRRGPAQAQFTLPELLELEKMVGVGFDLDLGGSSLEVPDDGPPTLRAKVEAIARLGARDDSHESRRIVLRFMAQPVAVLGQTAIERLVVARTRLDADARATATEQRDSIATGLMVWAVGFHGTPIPGVPFDARAGILPNVAGRVQDPAGDIADRGTYVAGWIKRGPSGVIGANKRCGTETAATLLADYEAGHLTRELPEPTALDELLRSRNIQPVDLAGWTRINSAERARGETQSRPRVKYLSRKDLLTVARATTGAAEPGGHPSGTASPQ